LLARILKQGGNFLMLDEPTNDLDLPTLRVLEEALIAFPGVVMVVSHDRYFLNRVCTDTLVFEGDAQIAHAAGNYDYYVEKRGLRRSGSQGRSPSPIRNERPASGPAKPRKLTWKETKELDGMEARILETEAEIARIESVFSAPDFHRTHATQTPQLNADLAAAKTKLHELYSRWEELEAVRIAAETKLRQD
jgi:ATP-binding cassette subfamily F protein uup